MAERSNATVSSTVITRGSNPFLGTCSVKDCFNVAGRTTNLGLDRSDLKYTALKDSRVYQLLKQSQRFKFVFSQLTQFCCGTLDPSRIQSNGLYAGASSSGSVLDLENFKCDVAITTDTGGSTIVPAARANLIGFKPTYGRISRRGCVPLCSFLDTVSIMARDWNHLKSTFEILDFPDSEDLSCLKSNQRTETGFKLKIAVNLFPKSQLEYLVKLFPEAKLEVLDLPPKRVLEGAYWYAICPQLFSNLNRFDGVHNKGSDSDLIRRYSGTNSAQVRSENLNTEVKSRVCLGALLLKKYRSRFLKDFVNHLNETFGSFAWVLPAAVNLKSNDENLHSAEYSVACNLTRRPVVTFPSTCFNGVQVTGPKNSDLQLLKLAQSLFTAGTVL